MCEDYSEERCFIISAVKNAFALCYAFSEKERLPKGESDIVTPVDLNIEKYIIESIKQAYPRDKILSEENLNDTDVFERTWTIDPIDGTFNMACDIPLFGIQCSLLINDAPVVAVIYLPLLNELYYAQAGFGAFLNNRRIYADCGISLKDAVISFGDFSHEKPEEAALQNKMIEKLSPRAAKIRMFGAASIDFAYAASGRTAGFVMFSTNKWDIAPGVLLCREAGALVKGRDGEYGWSSNLVIVAANKPIYDEFLSSMG